MAEGSQEDDDASLAGPLRSARPEREHAIARRVGLSRVLEQVFGRTKEATAVGRFVLGHKVGEGGMGVVYRGHDPLNGDKVAIKLLDRGDEKARTRFAHEAEVLRTLHHPRIVRYLDHGTTLPIVVRAVVDGRPP